MGKTFKLSKYVQEAAVEPFALELDESETLLIPAPDGDTMLDVEESGSSRLNIQLLCGEHADRVLEVLGSAPAGVMHALVQDMMRHFKISPEQAPPGGSRASRRS